MARETPAALPLPTLPPVEMPCGGASGAGGRRNMPMPAWGACESEAPRPARVLGALGARGGAVANGDGVRVVAAERAADGAVEAAYADCNECAGRLCV